MRCETAESNCAVKQCEMCLSISLRLSHHTSRMVKANSMSARIIKYFFTASERGCGSRGLWVEELSVEGVIGQGL